MIRIQTQLFTKLTFALLCMTTFLLPAHGQDSIKTIDTPGGGQIVYGPLTDESTLKGAMGTMLRNIHGHFGDRPQISKIFQARDSDSVATFFTLTAKSQGGKHIAGLVIVSMPAGTKPAAAVIYDDAERFGTTATGMLKKLQEVWHPDSAKPTPSSKTAPHEGPPAHESEALPLRTTRFPDNSGTIGLPEGWQITGAGGGTVHAAGPNGETVNLGVINQNIYDTRNPKAQSLIQYLIKAHTPYTVCPYGGDLVSAFMTISRQNRQRQGLPPLTLNVTSSYKVPAGPYEVAAIQVLGEMDMHDGKGPLVASMRIGAMKIGPVGGWAMTVSGVNIPKQLADEEWPTMRAIVSSYKQNGAVIQGQADEIIGRIHQTAKDAQDRMDKFHEANDRRNAAVEQTWDTQGKYNKSFQNYQFDLSVVQDNTSGAHGTMEYRYADALVKNDPNRYQYVKTPDFLKGVDY